MYSKIKAHWQASNTFAAAAGFRAFLLNLGHGGVKALSFIDSHADLMAMVCENVGALKAYIRQDNEAAENKTYFYNLAMRQLPGVKNVLQHKFDSTLVFAGVWYPDFDLEGLTPLNFLPELDRRARKGAQMQDGAVPQGARCCGAVAQAQGPADPTPAAETVAAKAAPKRKPRTKKS